MTFDFTNYWALVLIALVPLAIYISRRSLTNLSKARSVISITSRVLLLLLIVVALGGLRIRTSARDLALIFFIDVSSSVAQEDRERVLDLVNREVERAAQKDYIGVVAFAREPSVELAPTRKQSLGDWRLSEINSNPPRDYTNIAAALRLGAALVPADATGKFVLISDGNENLDSSKDEAQLLRASGIEVFSYSVGTTTDKPAGEIAVRDVEIPQKIAIGESFDVKVTIDSTTDTPATLRLYRNDSIAAERQVQISRSGENVFVVPQRADQKGFYTYRAEVEAAGVDGFVQNNARESFAVVEGRPKTLYLYGDDRPSLGIARVLIEGLFEADVRSSAAMPTSLAGFQNYDLVIFDNVLASALTFAQMKMVQSYVRDFGGGFVMIGGDQSFGPGGYYKTPIEEVLPVSLDVRQKKHLPSLALALVIDKSGSMDGLKMEMTQEASAATVDFMSDRDSVGVIAFDSQASPVVNLTKVEDKRGIIRQIDSIRAEGGTNMYPGLRMAQEWLQASDAQIKHIIVLSDGQSEQGDFRGIARSIRDAGMTMTTVAVGDDADLPMMKMLADVGGGRFYAADRPENLPRIFTREASMASRSTIIEEPFTARLARTVQATNGIDWSASPQLGGYVGTAERDSTKSPAIVSLISDKDDPVYAVWQYGLGRSAAFTSDAKPKWAAGWMNWPGFGQFWTQVFRDAIRRDSAAGLTPSVEITAGVGHVSVDAISSDGETKNSLHLRAHVVGPDFSGTEITLDQTAAGRYEGGFPAIERGAYLVTVSETDSAAEATAGAVNSYSPEFNIGSADSDLLMRVSELTGGRVLQAEEAGGAPVANRPVKTVPHDIWSTLVLSALLLLPLDVGVRRVLIARDQLDYARGWVRSSMRRFRKTDVQPTASSSMAKLKEARTRVVFDSSEAGKQAVANVAERSELKPKPDSTEPKGPENELLATRLLDAKKKRHEQTDAEL